MEMIENGKKLARDDFEKYKKNEMTKEELVAACQFAQLSAAFGDENFQQCGSDYLYEMERLGFIKLKRID